MSRQASKRQRKLPPWKQPGRRTATNVRCPTSGKMAYIDKLSANIALATIQARGNPAHSERRAYLCPDCKMWHLTSQRRKKASA